MSKGATDKVGAGFRGIVGGESEQGVLFGAGKFKGGAVGLLARGDDNPADGAGVATGIKQEVGAANICFKGIDRGERGDADYRLSGEMEDRVDAVLVEGKLQLRPILNRTGDDPQPITLTGLIILIDGGNPVSKPEVRERPGQIRAALKAEDFCPTVEKRSGDVGPDKT